MSTKSNNYWSVWRNVHKQLLRTGLKSVTLIVGSTEQYTPTCLACRNQRQIHRALVLRADLGIFILFSKRNAYQRCKIPTLCQMKNNNKTNIFLSFVIFVFSRVSHLVLPFNVLKLHHISRHVFEK